MHVVLFSPPACGRFEVRWGNQGEHRATVAVVRRSAMFGQPHDLTVLGPGAVLEGAPCGKGVSVRGGVRRSPMLAGPVLARGYTYVLDVSARRVTLPDAFPNAPVLLRPEALQLESDSGSLFGAATGPSSVVLSAARLPGSSFALRLAEEGVGFDRLLPHAAS